ncbi:MAG: DNA-formamidopyrimidine glycosylase [Enterococcus sp.]
MPELPEVETVRKGLIQLVSGKEIMHVDVTWPRIIEQPDVARFSDQLVGESIQDVWRRGKFLIFKLTHFDLVSHLRMEGKYEYVKPSSETAIDPHTHVIFTFRDGSQLHYQDVRKFGRMSLVAKDQAPNYPGIQKLGPEPTAASFKLQPFSEQLKRSKKLIKPLLLDQRLVTGLGNIYVDEALWQARIHPKRVANSLTEKEVSQLRQAIIEVLAKAVAAGGTTIRTYQNALGESGNFQTKLHVYGQTNQPCPRCQTLIVKTKVAQRGTHFCPQCQRLEEVSQ